MTDEAALAALVESEAGARTLTVVTRDSLAATFATLDPAAARWVETTRFAAEPGAHLLVPDGDGKPPRALHVFVVERYGGRR